MKKASIFTFTARVLAGETAVEALERKIKRVRGVGFELLEEHSDAWGEPARYRLVREGKYGGWDTVSKGTSFITVEG